MTETGKHLSKPQDYNVNSAGSPDLDYKYCLCICVLPEQDILAVKTQPPKDCTTPYCR